MENLQPKFRIETLPDGDTFPGVPRLSLPQITPAQVIATRQHSHAVSIPLPQPVPQTTPFPQTPMTPMVAEPLTCQSSVLQTKKDESSVSLLSVPQVPFPTPRIDFSHSLRAGITYIPRSMTRKEEPDVVDALIACGTLVLISLFILMLLYFFSM